MAQLVKDIQPRGIASAYVRAPFDQGKAMLEEEKYLIISLEQNARLRMQEGKDSFVARNGNWVREGFLYVPKKGKFLTKISPIMDHPVDATRTHGRGEEFYLINTEVERSLANSVKLKNREFSIPTNRFGDDKITAFAFGNSAKLYGNFLREVGIKRMFVSLSDNIGDEPFARQAWFYGLINDSKLLGYDTMLDTGGWWVRGVKLTSFAGSQSVKQDLSYTQRELNKYSRIVQKVREGNIPASKLEEVLGFLGGLKQ